MLRGAVGLIWKQIGRTGISGRAEDVAEAGSFNQMLDRGAASDAVSVANVGDGLRQEYLKQGDSGNSAGPVVALKAPQGGGLWAVAREAYRLTGKTDPSAQEVKALAQETARRNGLSLDTILADGQFVEVKLPGAIKQATDKKQAEKAVLPAPAKPAETARIVKSSGTHQAKETGRAFGPACSQSWEEVNMIAGWVTHNEAGHKSFTAFNPDDNGSGISVGLMQWNQERGKLPELVDAWHDKNPAKFDRIFAGSSANMLDESWLRSVDFSSKPALTGAMQTALADSEYQRVQVDLRNGHIEDSCELARDYRFTSLRGRAVVADLVNQLGEGGARSMLRRLALTGNESQRIERLKTVSDGRINAADRIAAIEEKVKEVWRAQAASR